MTCKHESWDEKIEKYICYRFGDYNTKKCRPGDCYEEREGRETNT